MDLPIAQSSYQPTPATLVREACRARVVLSRTLAEETQLGIATAFQSPAYPRLTLANHAAELRLSDESSLEQTQAHWDDLMGRFDQLGLPCLALTPNRPTMPPALASLALEQSYRPMRRRVLRAASYAASGQTIPHLQVIPARAAYSELPAVASAARDVLEPVGSAAEAKMGSALKDCLDEPRLNLLLARLHGRPVGLAGVLVLGPAGVLWPPACLETVDDPRLPSVLLEAVMDQCQRSMLERVLVDLPEPDPQKQPLPGHSESDPDANSLAGRELAYRLNQPKAFLRLGFEEVTHYERYHQQRPQGQPA